VYSRRPTVRSVRSLASLPRPSDTQNVFDGFGALLLGFDGTAA
jgi:hypothetical protein